MKPSKGPRQRLRGEALPRLKLKLLKNLNRERHILDCVLNLAGDERINPRTDSFCSAAVRNPKTQAL
jgi:hypothetical protein